MVIFDLLVFFIYLALWSFFWRNSFWYIRPLRFGLPYQPDLNGLQKNKSYQDFGEDLKYLFNFKLIVVDCSVPLPGKKQWAWFGISEMAALSYIKALLILCCYFSLMKGMSLKFLKRKSKETHINHMPERRIHIGIIYSRFWRSFTARGFSFRDPARV